jgi:hypothetical protein
MDPKLQRLLYKPQEEATDGDAGGGSAVAAAASAAATTTAGGNAAADTAGVAGKPAPAAAATSTAKSGSPDGAAAKPAAAAGTGADDGSAGAGDGTKKVTDDGPWGADWRTKMAGGDEAALKRLARYADPTAAVKALSQLQERISKGELKAPLGKDATPEQIAAWRTENGIPETPDKYDLSSLKIDARDKPIIDSFLKTAHAKGMNTEQTRDSIEWYYSEVTRVAEERAAADKAAASAAEDTLREMWGNTEYKANLASVNNLLATAPADVRDNLMYGRLADGTPILAHASTVQYLLGLALEINPASVLDLPGGGSRMDSVDSEIANIEKVMRTDRAAYNKDEKMQERYRTLLGAKEKLQTRGN